MTRHDWGFTALLAAVVVASAVVVVKTKQENRNLVHQIEQLRQQKAQLDTEWAQLQLEEATLAHHGRIEQMARDKLGMTDPADAQVVRTPASGSAP